MVLIASQPEPTMYRLTLNRPERRNALNPDLIRALTVAFRERPEDTRVVWLEGAGDMFCAGADLDWMRASLHAQTDDARLLADMLAAINDCSCPVIVYAHGGVFGGGLGLLAACDVVLAHPATRFCFSEAKLGLVPAVISPWVIRKIGYGALNALTLTAEVFTAEAALRIGLVNDVVDDPFLLKERGLAVTRLSPEALKTAKTWFNRLHPVTGVDDAIALINTCRQTPEAQEGMTAFLEKRSPKWLNPLTFPDSNH